jgi:hypothetical protein
MASDYTMSDWATWNTAQDNQHSRVAARNSRERTCYPMMTAHHCS